MAQPRFLKVGDMVGVEVEGIDHIEYTSVPRSCSVSGI